MPFSTTYQKKCLERLQALKFDYSIQHRVKIKGVLAQLAQFEFRVPSFWKIYYSELLFLLAYPADLSIFSMALKEISRLAIYLKKNRSLSAKLFNSGLPGTEMGGCFSYQLNRSLLDHNSCEPELESLDGDRDSIMQFLYPAFSGIEKEMLSEENLVWSRWKHLFTGNTSKAQYAFLIRQLGKAVVGTDAQEAAFAVFKLNTRITLENHIHDFIKNLGKQLFIQFHKEGLLKQAGDDIFGSGGSRIRQLKISLPIKRSLHLLAQRAIFPLFKETDPFTYARVEETEYFYCSRGISIALFYMLPEKKLELECYCGYLLIKNNVPLAYGGGWILGSQCRFGLNILPEFRGGESALICNTLMRLYVHHFKVNTIVIEPFQLGKGNSEGIQSASFWFYYKMGFRPRQKVLARLAADEFKKIKASGHYRSPAGVLKELSASIMILRSPGDDHAPYYDINAISLAVTGRIKMDFQNNREHAISLLSKKYSFPEKQLPFSVMIMMESTLLQNAMSKKEVEKLSQLYGAKNDGERKFVLGLQRQQSFLRLLQNP